jgi:hypothetical protein
MALEAGTYISDLVAANPLAADGSGQGDDHLRLLKSCIKATFPNITGAVTPTHTVLNGLDGRVTAIEGLYVKKDGTVTMTGSLNAGGFKITNVLTPAAGTDAVTKTYADLKLLNPLTTRGDLISGGVAGATQRLALGANATALVSNGTDAVWGDATPAVVAAAVGTAGKVALADTATTQAGASAVLAVTPAGLKGAVGFSKMFESGDQTGWAVGTVLTIAHGLGAKPKHIYCVFKCLSTEGGYAVGDEVYVDMMNISNSRGAMYAANATNIYVLINNSTVNMLNLSTLAAFNVTPANWAIVARGWA